MNVLIIKQNYVIDVCVFHEDIPDGWEYPHEHDAVKVDHSENVSIGDWYEEAEGLFYRPVNGIPADLPDELVRPTEG